jgi:hypothetical protein
MCKALAGAALTIQLLLICGSGVDANAHQSPIAEAKSKLEQLQVQLLRVETEGRKEVERRVAERVSTAPKGEFETTKAYEARRAKAGELKGQIEEEVAKETKEKKNDLNRRMNELLTARFTLPFESQLGTYDADAQTFPLVILPHGGRETLPVPLSDAKELKENFSRAEKIGVFSIHLNEQNAAREYLLAATVTYTGKEYRATAKGMDVGRAMYMLYGNYSAGTKRAKWAGEADWWEDPEDATQQLEALSIYSKNFVEGGADKFVLVTGSVPEGQEEFSDCHACGVKMGVAIFARSGGIWGLEVGQKDVGTYGSSGIPPEASLVKIGADRHALVLQSGYTGQGITTESTMLLDRAGGIFKEVLSVQTSEDTSAYGILTTPEDNVSYDSKVEYVPGSDPSHWDVRVTSQGKRGIRVGRRIVMRPFSEVKVYKFANGEYVLSK